MRILCQVLPERWYSSFSLRLWQKGLEKFALLTFHFLVEILSFVIEEQYRTSRLIH